MLKISVVTAVHNRAGTIGDALRSVSSQNYPSVEHIIQDGGSDDGTVQIIRSADCAAGLVSERDTGIYDAINRGIRRSTGDVVGLLHSDDLFADNHVLAAIAKAFSDPQVDGVYGDLHYVTRDNVDVVVRRWRAGHYLEGKLKWGWMPPHPTVYLRRHIYDRFGLYDGSFSIAADYDAMLRYLLVGKIRLAYLPQVLVKMRVGGASNSSLVHIVKKSAEDLRALRTYGVGGLATLAAKNLRKMPQFISARLLK